MWAINVPKLLRGKKVTVGGIKNRRNHYFGYQIRILRGRFTPGGFLLEEVF